MRKPAPKHLPALLAALALALTGCSASGEVDVDRPSDQRDGGVDVPDVDASVGSG